MITQSPRTLVDIELANRATATRFVGAFNDDDWDTVRAVVAEGFVFHHPIGGTVQAGPEGMVAAWSGFKRLSPDSWHPIPILIAEGDYAAVLLPTYGHFTGRSDDAPPPTGGRLDYGMVNIVRFDDTGRIAELWFGMDPLVELAQLGLAPAFPMPAFAPPERATGEAPYGGDPSVDTAASRAVVSRWLEDVLRGHRLDTLAAIASPNVVVHPTAMPGDAGCAGIAGVGAWLGELWRAFPDLTVVDWFTVASGDIVAARWQARGTSRGEFLGVAATGHSIDCTGISMVRVEAGRIAEIWETRNTLGILHQLDPRIGGGHRH